MSRSVAVPLALALTIASSASSQEPRSEYVSVGSHTLHFRLSGAEYLGSGSPAIILEAGGGNDSGYWAELQPQLAEQFRTVVVSYDRAGHGESELPERPYDIRQEVDDLRNGLTQLGLVDELILVGHSYGGMLVQVFTARNADRVSGLVFMDPNIPAAHHAPNRQWSNRQPPSPVFENPTTDYERAVARQVEASDRTMVTVFSEAFMPEDIPVVVISAEEGLFGDDRLNEAYVLAHQLLAKSFTNGQWISASGVGHNIIPERSDLVVESVGKLLSAVR